MKQEIENIFIQSENLIKEFRFEAGRIGYTSIREGLTVEEHKEVVDRMANLVKEVNKFTESEMYLFRTDMKRGLEAIKNKNAANSVMVTGSYNPGRQSVRLKDSKVTYKDDLFEVYFFCYGVGPIRECGLTVMHKSGQIANPQWHGPNQATVTVMAAVEPHWAKLIGMNWYPKEGEKGPPVNFLKPIIAKALNQVYKEIVTEELNNK
jgi:hypothetical protein